MNRAADDFDAIRARLGELRSTAIPSEDGGIAVDVAYWYDINLIGVMYRPLTDKAKGLFFSMYVAMPDSPDTYKIGGLGGGPWNFQDERIKSLVFEERPAP